MKIIANLKMSLNQDKIKEYLEKVSPVENLIVCPSYIFLNDFKNYNVAAQDVSINNNGSYTGEISAEQLNSINVKYCIIGHSERRKYHKENNEILQQKLNKLLENKITPIFCIGEEEKLEELTYQLEILTLENCYIAYEPVWAIGTGKIPTNEKIIEAINIIRQTNNQPIFYGGSVTPKNINKLSEIKELEGFLIGSAACIPESINQMLKLTRQN